MERTLIIIKPDAVQRGLVGEITRRFENRGLRVIAMKLERLSDAVLKEHYAHHATKPFFPELVKFMRSTPSVLMILEGNESCRVVRQMLGPTNGRDALPGTIRGDYSLSTQNNLVHASETAEIATTEVARFFKPHELHSFELALTDWVYNLKEKQ